MNSNPTNFPPPRSVLLPVSMPGTSRPGGDGGTNLKPAMRKHLDLQKIRAKAQQYVDEMPYSPAQQASVQTLRAIDQGNSLTFIAKLLSGFRRNHNPSVRALGGEFNAIMS